MLSEASLIEALIFDEERQRASGSFAGSDESPAGQGFDAEAEAAIFDSWQAPEGHRPPGEVMRAQGRFI